MMPPADANAAGIELCLAACAAHERRHAVLLLGNQVGQDMKFTVAMVRDVASTPSTIQLAQDHFPILTTRKVKVAR